MILLIAVVIAVLAVASLWARGLGRGEWTAKDQRAYEQAVEQERQW